MTAPLLGSHRDGDLHVMTLNVRRDLGTLAWPRADRWPTRQRRVSALLRAERPHVVGVQEALPAQASLIGAALGPSYRMVGHGRRPGRRGEGCPLFFDAERLELRDWRQCALSRHPEREGSSSWLSAAPRIVVEAILRDRITGREITVLNTHLDAFSPWARLRQAQTIRGRASEATSPVLVLGDLNARAGSAPWRALQEGGLLSDSWTASAARCTPAWGTFARYRAPRSGRRIDAILASPELPVRRAGINGRQYERGWPSDHLPVQALFDLASCPADSPEEEAP
ncbi:endonuclease/exonuclease/phosphatase family protein [Microbacterium sp. NPDC055665]